MSRPATHPSHWTTPAGLKYLGPHTDTTPLEVTVVLRRRAGAAPQPAGVAASAALAARRIWPALRRRAAGPRARA